MFINSKNIVLYILSILLIISIILNIIYINKSNKNKQDDTDKFINSLKPYMSDDLRAPKLEKGGTVRVYVSGGMFDIADTIYSIGIDGMKPGLDYQSINLIDMICNFKPEQMDELKKLCIQWDVPWYGIIGEIKNLGWECYCPVRDGLTMATLIAAVSVCTMDEIIKPYDTGNADSVKWDQSLFNPINFPKDKTDEELLDDFKAAMIYAIGTNIGAQDLYNMYSTCNACILNYNGIEPDAGALAEIGSLGARGVPSVIIKGSLQGDFSGISNPMPIMATTTNGSGSLIPNLTINPGSIYYKGAVAAKVPPRGALDFLKNKVNRFIEASVDNKDPLTNGNYNNLVPLPPLQIFWSDLGSKSFFLKHKSKSIVTLDNGKTDFINDYTDFWYENVVNSKDILSKKP